MNPEAQQPASSMKTLWIVLGTLCVLVFIGGAIWFFWGRGGDTGGLTALFPFSDSTGSATGDGNTSDRQPIDGGFGDGSGESPDALFRRLSDKPVSGATIVLRGENTYVRYVQKETGHVYEIPIADGDAEQLTNTTIPRVVLADWADAGNAVVLRYLEEDPYTGRETIKTHLARLNLSSASSSDDIGSLTLDLLPDNIIALSVSPNGRSLFYLVKKDTGVAGSLVTIATKATKEVFRHPFTEWLPQLLNDERVILTTKPSGNVSGYSYIYDTKARTLSRLVREKDGLTLFANPLGTRVLFSENVLGGVVLSAYNPKGFGGDEGVVFYENVVPISTLAEKCAWSSDSIRVFCGVFSAAPEGLVPDLWYQGRTSFDDTFWMANVDTGEIEYLTDPREAAGQSFDVVTPILAPDNSHLVFVNKKDGTLWAMRIVGKTPPPASDAIPENLSPEELKDAEGSINTR